MEGSHSGRLRMLGKHVTMQVVRGFESPPFRQVLHSAKLKEVASAQSASAWYFSAILKAFLKSKTKVRSAMRKFEPIFFRKSRPCSGFSKKDWFELPFERAEIVLRLQKSLQNPCRSRAPPLAGRGNNRPKVAI